MVAYRMWTAGASLQKKKMRKVLRNRTRYGMLVMMERRNPVLGPDDPRHPGKRILLGGQPDLGKPRLSWSRHSRYLGCGRQYWYQYVAGVEAPSSAAMTVGSAFHAAVALSYERTRAGLPVVEEGIRKMASSAILAEGVGDDPTAAALAGDAAVAHWYAIGAHQRPSWIEQPFLVSLGDEFPWTLYGIFDLLTDDGWVRDNKLYSVFSARKAGRTVDADGQLTFYGLAYQAIFGALPEGLALDVVIKPPERGGSRVDPEIQAMSLCTTRTEGDVTWMLGQIREAVRGIDARIFPPQPDAWFCSQKWCSYWARCMGASRAQRGEAHG